MLGVAPSLVRWERWRRRNVDDEIKTKRGRRDHRCWEDDVHDDDEDESSRDDATPDEQQRLFKKELLKRPDENGRYGEVDGGKYNRKRCSSPLGFGKEYEAENRPCL